MKDVFDVTIGETIFTLTHAVNNYEHSYIVDCIQKENSDRTSQFIIKRNEDGSLDVNEGISLDDKICDTLFMAINKNALA